jgi:hypothetical protein
LSRPAIRNPFFHVGFIVPDLDAAMKEFHAALGITWRAPADAMVPLRGPDGVIEAKVYSVYSEGGPPAIELIQSVPSTPLAANGVSFHHLGFWTDRLATSSRDLDAHGWPCAATSPASTRTPGASRFTSPRTTSMSSCSTPRPPDTPTCCQTQRLRRQRT